MIRFKTMESKVVLGATGINAEYSNSTNLSAIGLASSQKKQAIASSANPTHGYTSLAHSTEDSWRVGLLGSTSGSSTGSQLICPDQGFRALSELDNAAAHRHLGSSSAVIEGVKSGTISMSGGAALGGIGGWLAGAAIVATAGWGAVVVGLGVMILQGEHCARHNAAREYAAQIDAWLELVTREDFNENAIEALAELRRDSRSHGTFGAEAYSGLSDLIHAFVHNPPQSALALLEPARERAMEW